jgi:hypothetical protein
VHIEEPVHLRLHDEPHEPEQSFMFAQSSVQLLPHVAPPIVHDCPDGHVHDEPVHLGGLSLVPQAVQTTSTTNKRIRIGPSWLHSRAE